MSRSRAVMRSGFRSASLVGGAVAAALALGACGDSDADGGGETPATDKTIGMVVPTLNNPFFVTVADSAKKAAQEAGYTVSVLSANNDPQKQLGDATDLIAKNPACLIVDPVDEDAIVPAVQAANRADIPVAAVDRKPSGGDIINYTSSDQVEVGKTMGEWIVDELEGKGNVAIIEGIVGAASVHDRTVGFREATKGTDIEEVALQSAAYDRAKAVSVTTNILTANPNIDLIYAENDDMALGAIEALEQAGREDDILVTGIDAIPEGVEAVKKGTLAATLDIHPELYGKSAVEACIASLNGETPEEEYIVPSEVVSNESPSAKAAEGESGD